MQRSLRRLTRAVDLNAACIKTEALYSANNYAPLPVVFAKAKGVAVEDLNKKTYTDFLAGYGSVNQGHLHPKIVKAAVDQLQLCTLPSRAFYSDNFASYASIITKLFEYERVLPMNTGAEGVETALKLSRKWGYLKKNIPTGEGIIVCCTGCFHGRTLGVISMSDDPDAYSGYEPKLAGFHRVEYGNAKALEEYFRANHAKISGFIAEPIQGEAGVIIPPKSYFKEVRRLCTEYNILFIADEVQSGLGRTGKMLAIHHEEVRPDVVILAKALGGGVLPVSAVLADTAVMEVFTPGTHGSTFGGNPLANAVATAALGVLIDEKLSENSAKMGAVLLSGLEELKAKFPIVHAVRGRGLFAAIELNHEALQGKAAYTLMHEMAKRGVLSKTTHGHTLRLTPPLVITEAEVTRALGLLGEGLAVVSEMANAEAK